jgi:hypothetical protein
MTLQKAKTKCFLTQVNTFINNFFAVEVFKTRRQERNNEIWLDKFQD